MRSGRKNRAQRRRRDRARNAVAAVWLDSLLHDLRHTIRELRRSPVFAVTAVLTLALGIGATTAVFTLIQQVMLGSLPIAHPQQLWRIGDAVACCYSTGYTQANHAAQNDWTLFSWEAYQRFRAATAAFEELAAFQIGTGNGELAVRRAGSLALLLAMIGAYGVTSSSVAQRTSEIGIRAALGATRADLLRMVLRECSTSVALGIGIGLTLSMIAARAIATLLFDVRASDPMTLAGAAALLAGAALMGCYLPARRASRVDPLSALRTD